MPHAELKYSADLDIPVADILRDIEAVILSHDVESGECKGRAYPAEIFHHPHVLVEVMMLKKPHRDEAFTAALMRDLEDKIKSHLTQPCFFSLSLGYNDGWYVTNSFDPKS